MHASAPDGYAQDKKNLPRGAGQIMMLAVMRLVAEYHHTVMPC